MTKPPPPRADSTQATLTGYEVPLPPTLASVACGAFVPRVPLLQVHVATPSPFVAAVRAGAGCAVRGFAAGRRRDGEDIDRPAAQLGQAKVAAVCELGRRVTSEGAGLQVHGERGDRDRLVGVCDHSKGAIVRGKV